MLDRARALHAARPVVELHADVPLDTWRRRRAGEAAPLLGDWLGRWREGGVDVSLITVGGDMPVSFDALGRPDLRAQEMIADTLAEEAACAELRVIRTAGDGAAGGGAGASGDAGPELTGWATYPEGLRRIETLPLLPAGLFGRGFTEDDAAAIVGGSALRVLRAVLR